MQAKSTFAWTPAVQRVADKRVTFMRHPRANLMTAARPEEFHFDKSVVADHAQHTPSATADRLGFAAGVHRDLRAALVATRERECERPRKDTVGETSFDEREIRFANVAAAAAECIAETRAFGIVFRNEQTPACFKVEPMDEARFVEFREFRPRGTQPRLDARRIAPPLRDRVNTRGLCENEPRALLTKDGNVRVSHLRFHLQRRTLPDMRLDRHLIHAVALLVALLVALPLGAALPTASSACAEVPNQPMWSLRQSAFELEVTVLSVEEKAGPGPHDTSVWHRVRVDHVVRSDGLKPGDETAVVSKVHELPAGTVGSRGQRGPFRGLNGLPVKGDRARLFANGTTKILQPAFPNGWQTTDHWVSFIAADDEYKSEVTMPFLASLVEQAGIARATLHFAADPEDPTKRDISSKTAISDAAAIGAGGEVVYMRFNRLCDRDREAMLEPLEHGMPLVAFRTATHAFAYPEDSPHTALNAGFGKRFLGTPWRFHHGHSSKTRVLPPTDEAAKHPILAGVRIPAEGIVVPSWLYHVEPLPADCRVLLWGEAIESERKDAPQKQPVLWVREQPPPQEVRGGSSPPRLQRIAVTTLGHPGDFGNPEFRLVAVQMIAWANERMHVLDDAKRQAIREAAFAAPPTR